jgi:hypothetical protein
MPPNLIGIFPNFSFAVLRPRVLATIRATRVFLPRRWTSCQYGDQFFPWEVLVRGPVSVT